MKKLIVTDTHLGMYSDSDAWLDIVLNFYKHIVKYCIQNNITQLIHLGDFFDNRKSLNTKTQHTAHRIARTLKLAKDLHTYIIVGNHDCYYKNKIKPNTLELFEEYKHITVVDEITKLDDFHDSKYDILLVPWGEIPDDTQGCNYCAGHFAINGFHMNDSYKCKTGLDRVRFKDFEKVFSGHFHTPSSKDNILYLGAPYGQTFHDAGGYRGYYVFEDGRYTLIEYEDAPKFVKVYTNEVDEAEIEGNVVKIIFTQDYGTTKNQEIVDKVLLKKPFLYSVNFTNIDNEEDSVIDDESIEMDSKEQIVNQFIDTQVFPANINVATLKSMFMKMLKEAGESTTKIKSADGTKIECLEVGFQNFLSFGSTWQDLPLHHGVNFVTGIDKSTGKSNGAGKSSFLETIPFALFGKTARDIKQDQIINWKNKKNCQVVFRFRINEDLYEIKRTLKPNKLMIYKNGVELDQDAHKSDYQSMFEEIFGMDVKMFMSLVHSNINGSANIMSMKKAEKRTFLERMFGLKIYSDMNKLCNEKLRSVENRRYKYDTDAESADEKIESAKEMKNKFKLEIKSKQDSIEDVDRIKEHLDTLKENNPTLDADIESLNKEIEDKKETFNSVTLKFEKWKSKLDAEVEHLKKEIRQIDDQEEQRKRNDELNAKRKAIIDEVGSVSDISIRINEIEGLIESRNKSIDKLDISHSNIKMEIVELETNLKNIEKNLELLAEGKCPVCGQDVTDPKTHYKKESTTFKRNITLKTKKLHEVGNDQSILIDEEKSYKRDKRYLREQKELILRYESQIKDIGTEKEKEALVADKEQKIKKIEDAYATYKEKKASNIDQVNALSNKLKDLKEAWSVIVSREQLYQTAKAKADEVKKLIISLKEMIKEQDKAIELAKSKKSIAESSQVRLNDMGDYLNSIKIILKDENIKQFTIKQIMPFLNKQTNYYLSEVNYSFYVNIDKWLDVEIKGPGIRNATYGSLSGGEKRGIDLALQLSLLDIARTQAGIFPDILIFDELLDSSIDGRGIIDLMKIVKVKQTEFNGKIFIISHRDEIDSEMVDNQYMVVKENGYSKVQV